MTHAQPFPFHQVLSRRGNVDEQIDQMVLEEVDLIDVEKSAIGACQKSGLEGLHALRQGAFQIERADDPILGHTERHVDHGDRNGPVLERAGGGPFPALGAPRVRIGGITRVAAADDGAHGRQQCGQRANGRGFTRTPVAEHQHPADTRVDGRANQRKFHVVLADDCRKWENGRCA